MKGWGEGGNAFIEFAPSDRTTVNPCALLGISDHRRPRNPVTRPYVGAPLTEYEIICLLSPVLYISLTNRTYGCLWSLRSAPVWLSSFSEIQWLSWVFWRRGPVTTMAEPGRNYKLKKKKITIILGASVKLRKATITFVMSVCPHGTTRFLLVGFHEISYLSIFSKICRENSSFIKIRQE